MKREMEIIRLLLLQQETGEEPPELKEYDQKLVVHNIALMLDAGLIEGQLLTDSSGTPSGAAIIRLTWDGHDFLDSMRDPSIWAKAKEKVLKPGMSWTFSILLDFLKAEAQRRISSVIGLPPTQ